MTQVRSTDAGRCLASQLRRSPCRLPPSSSRSAAGAEDFPRDRLPEVALVGRSNVGKSSLINALVRRAAGAHERGARQDAARQLLPRAARARRRPLLPGGSAGLRLRAGRRASRRRGVQRGWRTAYCRTRAGAGRRRCSCSWTRGIPGLAVGSSDAWRLAAVARPCRTRRRRQPRSTS